jgi:Ca2+-binding RTX toxin-like protein
MSTVFNFTSGVVADTDANDGSTTRQATQTIGADTLTVALDSASGATAVVMADTAYFGADIANLNGAMFAMVNNGINIANSLTLSLDGGKIFDLTSINITDQNATPSVNFIFTTTKGSVAVTIDSSSGAIVVPLSDPKLHGVTSVTITQQGGGLLPAVDDITIDNITPPNAAPTFVGASSTLTVAQNSGASSASALLHVSDTDSFQTMTWTSFSSPSHGTLSISSATAASGAADITPGGVITYTPAAGFAGVDTFTVQVSDGVATTTRVISVNVGPATPGTPDLAAGSDSGSLNNDNITNAATLNFSGVSAAGDSNSSVRVFVDKNNNGAYDAGTDFIATATVDNGSWSVSGLSTTGMSDGAYNVYAQVTSATGNLTSSLSSALVIQIDKTLPGQTLSGLSLSADSGDSASDFITNTATQTISATLSGALTGGDILHGSLDGGSTWTNITSKVSGTTVTWNGVTLSASGDLQMRVVDAAGNGGAIASHTYTLDTVRPNPPGALDMTTGTDTGASHTDNITSNTTPVVTGTAEAGATVTLYDTDGVTVLGVATATGGNWSITTTALSEGTHTLTAKATDTAGNVSDASSGLTATIDTTPPTLAITTDASTLKIGETTTITFTFSEDPGASFSSANVIVSGGTLGALSGSGLTRTATFTPTADLDSGAASVAVANGSYIDAAGNNGAAGIVSLSFDTRAPSAPSVPALTSGSDSGVLGDRVTNIDTPTFTGTSEAGATIKLYDTDESTLLGSAVADGSGNWTIVSSRLSVGAHTIAAEATDPAGNVSSTGPVVVVTIEAVQTPEPQPEPEPGVVTVVTPFGNEVTGDAHDNLIAPSGGADTVSGGGGNDTVQGGASSDLLQGNVGNDSIAAGGGSDLAYGGQGDDFVNGNVGDDRLYGDKGADTVHGGQGDDFVHGGQGNDYVFGDLGDDVLLGGQGDDHVVGGAGNDYLSGDLGSDTLTGGAGADTFHSFGGAGLDLVTDFNQAEGDRVLLDPGTSYVLSQVGGDVHVTMSGGELILAGVQLSSLTEGWII